VRAPPEPTCPLDSVQSAQPQIMTDISSTSRPAATDHGVPRGTNQSGMRAHNERVVLTLLRRQEALAKSDIARITGLSAQAVSVIMRALERDGLLRRGAPVRGRVGQPSVPMSLAPDGAFFLGLKIGRRSADLILVDFVGRVRGKARRLYPWPTPGNIIAFVTETLDKVAAGLSPAERKRIAGFGVATPFELWSWVDHIGAPQAEMDIWRQIDIGAELAAATGLPVHVQNDASAACGAELVFGQSAKPRDFLYFYFGFFIGGGLVLDGQLVTGRNGNAAGVGPMPVPGPDGRVQRLMEIASIWPLARTLDEAGHPAGALWESSENWRFPEDVVSEWINHAARALASAILSASALLELDAVIIDGWMPQEVRAKLVERTRIELHEMDLAGIAPPQIDEGSIGPDARALGAAAIPLALRYMLGS
jgi:predicted NBD/HSP70 family sugar kinase